MTGSGRTSHELKTVRGVRPIGPTQSMAAAVGDGEHEIITLGYSRYRWDRDLHEK
jgi:hypothetical protein